MTVPTVTGHTCWLGPALCRVAGVLLGKETLERRRSGQMGQGLVRRGEAKRVAAPCVPSPELGIVGCLAGTPRARSSPALLRLPLCGGAPHMHPSALLQERRRGQQREEREAQRQTRRGESVLLAGWGARFPLASRGRLGARPHRELSHNNIAQFFQPNRRAQSFRAWCPSRS